ncbi:MAG: heparinase II/III family protein [Maritimibacter sp.]
MHAAPVNTARALSAPVAELLAQARDKFGAYLPVPAALTRKGWTGLDAATCADLVSKAEAQLGTDWPELPLSLYRSFCETGAREPYETPYFARRLMLNDLVLGECAEGSGRFLAKIAEGIGLICDELGWQLPAHNAYIRDTPQLPEPDPARPVVDLFAAETGAQLAMVAHLIGPALDNAAPGLTARIDSEIATRLVTPYLTAPPWWTGAQGGQMNNWTAWCSQNMLRAVFLRPELAKMRGPVAQQVAASLDAFLAEYGEDGACAEGAYYYRHAALCLFAALEVLDAASHGTTTPLWQQTKIRNMAEFILNMHVAGDYYINFADASAVLAPCGVAEYRFGKAVGSQALMAHAAGDVARQVDNTDPIAALDLTARVQALFAAEEIAGFSATQSQPGDIWFPSTQMLVARDQRFVLAVKAGHNDDPHNHNDVGSVTLYADDKPLLIDVGVETYTAKTFSPDRYDIWTMQSGYHNLADFGGIGQSAGREFAAQNVEVSLTAKSANFACDLANAYPDEAGVSHYRRQVNFDHDRSVEIVDTCVSSRPATLSLMFAAPVTPGDAHVDVAGFGQIAITGAGAMGVEEIAISDPRLRRAWPATLYRLRLPFAGTRLTLRINQGASA